jgi:hypothetical protein
MAPEITDGKKTPDQPDGAPPGKADPSPNYAFDADERFKTREQAPITIGGQTFHRRRKNWEATRALRKLLRVQERAGSRGARLAARVEALTEEIRGVRDLETGRFVKPPITDDARIDEIEAEVEKFEKDIDKAGDAADNAVYAIIELLLRDENGNSPEVKFLKAELDVDEAGDLAAALAGGGETLEGPTQTTTEP